MLLIIFNFYFFLINYQIIYYKFNLYTQFFFLLLFLSFFVQFFFFFSSRRRHTRSCLVSWARRCVQETGINAEYMGDLENYKKDVISKSEDDKKCFGGVIMTNDDGNIIFKNTFDIRVDLCFQDSLPQIREIMFQQVGLQK
eukprot:TRINITY_DN7386_c0_g1_i3.p2 TRINITY_DN7386_c0_g1~~TRINITY_DN7386_c0_g1_i3.p2  ORF type:complete len:141 (-),score=35.01 TRINITY_DN7386_c0_g1_i3:122-544(-)